MRERQESLDAQDAVGHLRRKADRVAQRRRSWRSEIDNDDVSQRTATLPAGGGSGG
jgi:hypothetical protein